MIGIALLGAGFAGRRQAAGWRASKDARLVGIWSRTHANSESLAADYDTEAYQDLDALITSPLVDAVDIATAMESHLALAIRAAEAGKNVLCQKPLAPNLAEARRLVDSCDQAGVRLMVNENFRWRPWYRTIRELLDAGTIGKPFYLRLDARSGWALTTRDRPSQQVFASQAFLRTMTPLILLEVGVHYLDIVRCLFGDPDQVYARTLKITPRDVVRGEDVASLMLAYPDRTAVVEMSWASSGYGDETEFQPDIVAIEGSAGTLFLERSGQVRSVDRDGLTRSVAVDTAGYAEASWAAPLQHFVDRLEDGGPFETSGVYGLETLRMVFQSYRSARTGAAINL